MKIMVYLTYYRTRSDGTEEDIPLPDNFPDQVELEVKSIDEVGKVISSVVVSDLHLHKASIPSGLGFKWRAGRVDNPSRN
jgi:hypothetical protein